MIASHRRTIRIVLLIAFLATSIVASRVAIDGGHDLTTGLLAVLAAEIIAIGLTS